MNIDPAGGYGHRDIDNLEVYARVSIKGRNTPSMLDILTGIRGIEDVITARQVGSLKKAPENKSMVKLSIGVVFKKTKKAEELKELEKKILRIPGVDIVKIKTINQRQFSFDPNEPDGLETKDQPATPSPAQAEREARTEGKLPFVQRKLNNKIIRKFSNNILSEELSWHRDEKDRVVKIVKGTGWGFQLDNSLPQTLQEGDEIKIPKLEWHRIIKGVDDLVIEILEVP